MVRVPFCVSLWNQWVWLCVCRSLNVLCSYVKYNTIMSDTVALDRHAQVAYPEFVVRGKSYSRSGLILLEDWLFFDVKVQK